MESNSFARTEVVPIDISSSEESDVDDIVMETKPATLADFRSAFQSPVTTMQEPYSIGYGGLAQGLPLKGNSSIFNNHKLGKIQMQPSSSVDDRLSNKNIFNRDESNDYASKGSLPRHFQPSTSTASLSAMSSENVESKNQAHEVHADTFYPRVSEANNGMDYNKENLSEESDDEILMYEKVGSTIVPPAFRPVKTPHYDNSGYEELRNAKVYPSFTFASTSQYTNKGIPVNHNDIAEEKAREQDERLIYRAALQDLNQPKKEASLPDGLLSVPLLRHQKIALAWFLEKETTSLNCSGGILADDQGLGKTISMIALIQMQRYLESKPKLEYQHKETMEALNLDDDDDDVKPIPSLIKITPSRVSRKTRPAAGTLVVCPASVLRQWARELKEKVTDEAALKVLIYHGGNRTKDPVELALYDVVLTTYAIVTNEVPKAVEGDEDEKRNGEKYGLHPDFSKKPKKESKKRKKGKMVIDDFANEFGCGTLAKVTWLRVILDEAQIIKNHKTKAARACCGLRAKRRWCLSGTPLQNTIDELFSYFRFLRYEPFATYISFQTGIKHPISRNSSQGYLKLQAVLRAIMLRRTKGTLIDGEPILNLPPKTINLDKIEFSSYERDFYDKLEVHSRSQFKKYADAGTVNQNYASILLMLLRLRQACGSPQLTKKSSGSRSVSKASLLAAKKLPRDTLLTLLDRLETSLPICCLCGDPPEETVISSGCGHIFCRLCVLEYLSGDDYTCPTPKCKQQLKTDSLFSRSTLRICISNNDPADEPSMSFDGDESLVMDEAYLSSKIKAAIKILESECKPQCTSVPSLVKCEGNSSSDCDLNFSVHTTIRSDSTTEGPVKAIVFSQWTRMLDLLEVPLGGTGLKYRRLDGTMNLNVRDEAVRDFNTNPEVTVMLMSLKAGNLGLNMVAATHVLLLDLWWNPTTEDQAVDRAHRIGQTRPVTVTRFTIKNTIEERILLLQEEKRKMVASAFGEDYKGGSATRLTVQDLKYLFKF